jgi:hypothetical protein
VKKPEKSRQEPIGTDTMADTLLYQALALQSRHSRALPATELAAVKSVEYQHEELL